MVLRRHGYVRLQTCHGSPGGKILPEPIDPFQEPGTVRLRFFQCRPPVFRASFHDLHQGGKFGEPVRPSPEGVQRPASPDIERPGPSHVLFHGRAKGLRQGCRSPELPHKLPPRGNGPGILHLYRHPLGAELGGGGFEDVDGVEGLSGEGYDRFRPLDDGTAGPAARNFGKLVAAFHGTVGGSLRCGHGGDLHLHAEAFGIFSAISVILPEPFHLGLRVFRRLRGDRFGRSPEGHVPGEAQGDLSVVRVSRGAPVLFHQGVVPADGGGDEPRRPKKGAPLRPGISPWSLFPRGSRLFHLRRHFPGEIPAVPGLHFRKDVSGPGGRQPLQGFGGGFFEGRPAFRAGGSGRDLSQGGSVVFQCLLRKMTAEGVHRRFPSPGGRSGIPCSRGVQE